ECPLRGHNLDTTSKSDSLSLMFVDVRAVTGVTLEDRPTALWHERAPARTSSSNSLAKWPPGHAADSRICLLGRGPLSWRLEAADRVPCAMSLPRQAS